jgi:hypothetical protein
MRARPVPTELGNFPSMADLHLTNNAVSGTIPLGIDPLSGWLDLGLNKVTPHGTSHPIPRTPSDPLSGWRGRGLNQVSSASASASPLTEPNLTEPDPT